MSWGISSIGEIANVKGGKRLPKGHKFSMRPTPYLYIRARDIGNGKITFDEPTYLQEETFRHIKNYTVDVDDIVITIVGANIGDIAIITKKFSGANLTENAAKLVIDKKKCAPCFLKYQLVSQYMRSKLLHLASGAAQGKLGLYKIKEFEVKLPPIATQVKIASQLKAYDDLIENNNRRIQLLEESARLLYQEWFVRLRFPNYEKVKVVDGVPEGWEFASLGDVVTLNYGKALKASDRVEGSFPVYGSGGCVGTHEKALISAPSIIVGRKGSVGSVFWVDNPAYPIDTVYFISPEQSDLYLYHVLQTMQFVSTDAAVPGLNRNWAYSRKLLLPPIDIKDQFLAVVSKKFEAIKNLQQQNQKLTQARDFLLPRLMNGDIKV